MSAVSSTIFYQFYEYNQRGLLSNVFVNTSDSKPSIAEVTYTYTATGAIDNIDYKGSKDANYAYTIRDWVKSINNVGNPGGNFAADYNYFDNGNVENAQYHNPQVQTGGGPATHQWAFGYDGINRLTDANFEGSSSKFDVTGLDYDAAGNLTDLQRNDDSGSLIDNLSYDYSGSNRLQSVTDAVGSTSEPWDAETVNSFGYDANGNLTSQSGKLDDIAYEHRNLPTQFALASGDTVIANYNADGQRILKELKGGAWQFYVMDGQQTLAVIDENGFSHFNLVGNSTFGRWEPGGARRYYITDHLGSTRAVVDNSGNVLETFDYYPFGLLMPKRNTAGANTLEKFTGKERDTEANLNLDYFGARYYDAALGRWHGVDPKASKRPGISPYNYVQNNPLVRIDPDGQLDKFLISEGKHKIGHAEQKGQDQFYYQDKEGNRRKLDLSNSNDLAIIENKLGSNDSFKKLVTRDGGKHAPREVASVASTMLMDKSAIRTIGKVTAFGVGMAGAAITAGGIAAGGSSLVAAGAGLSEVSTYLSASVDISEGNNKAALAKVITGQFNKVGYKLARGLESSEKALLEVTTFIKDNLLNSTVNASTSEQE